MATTQQYPRKKLIIKFFSKPSLRHEVPSQVSYSCNQPSHRVSKVYPLKNKKGYYAMAIWVDVDTKNTSQSSVADSGISKTGSEDGRLKNKKEDTVRVECNKKEKKRKVQHHAMTMTLDRCKKMQCWAMLKRLMVGRDAWVFKKDILDPKVRYVLDKTEALRKPKGLEDVETKLKSLAYSKADEFVDDVRLVLSYALQYPQRSEVHRTASRISDAFEVTWNTMKEKWMREERDQSNKKKKICSKRNDDDHDGDGEVGGKVMVGSYLTKGELRERRNFKSICS